MGSPTPALLSLTPALDRSSNGSKQTPSRLNRIIHEAQIFTFQEESEYPIEVRRRLRLRLSSTAESEMLLRSASTPLMKSWSHHNHQSELTISITSPKHNTLSPNQKNRALCRAMSDTDLLILSSTNLKSTPTHTFLENIDSDDSETSSFNELATLTCPCFNGGEGGGGSGHGGGSHNNNNENDDMDEYYQNAIKDNPGSGLILGNYARFLKEVKGDAERAAEYCERAILAKSGDGYVLAMYGELIWEMERDGFRAKTYFDRAVKSAPDNCYVLASYARFMWDVEDEEDVEDDEEEDDVVLESGGFDYEVEKIKLMKKSFAVLPPLAASS